LTYGRGPYSNLASIWFATRDRLDRFLWSQVLFAVPLRVLRRDSSQDLEIAQRCEK
ncbi:hypothetical protein FS749_011104, partial [Ceratobasidium sp. UAMH 11750]